MKIVHPYEKLDGGEWLRGNLHTHTTNSDGQRPGQEVVDDYKNRGYGFLMISDHDYYTSPADLAKCDSGDMVLIPGNEISAQGVHLLHVNAKSLVPPDKDRQKVIDAVNADGGICVVNHPNWHAGFNHCSHEQLQTWKNYVGLEIYNGVIGRLHGSPYATNHLDMLLSSGRRVWGFANDDSHAAQGDVGLGWNTVYAERNVDSIVSALARGRFYASTGVTISAIKVENDSITIETKNAEKIVALRETGKRFAEVEGNAIEIKIPEGAKYVRFECWGSGESFAWTQAFFIEK